MNKIKLIFFALILLMANTLVFAQTIKIPKLTSSVIDKAKLLSIKEREMLQKRIKKIFSNGGPQIQILTVENVQGLEIEDFSIRVAESWKIGSKEDGNGIIIIVAKEERKVRIEVGDGIEGDLTDYKSNQIIQEKIIPQFKLSRFSQGLQAAIIEIDWFFKRSGKSFDHRNTKASISHFLLRLCIAIGIFVIVFFVLDKKIDSPAKKIIIQMGLCFLIIYIATFSFLVTLVLSIMLPSLLSIKTYSDRNPYPTTDTTSATPNQYSNEKIGLAIQILDILISSGGSGKGGGFGGGGSWSGGGGGFSGGGSSGSW